MESIFCLTVEIAMQLTYRTCSHKHDPVKQQLQDVRISNGGWETCGQCLTSLTKLLTWNLHGHRHTHLIEHITLQHSHWCNFTMFVNSCLSQVGIACSTGEFTPSKECPVLGCRQSCLLTSHPHHGSQSAGQHATSRRQWCGCGTST